MTNSEARKRAEEASETTQVTMTAADALDLAIEMLVSAQSVLSQVNNRFFRPTDEDQEK
jgi:hypothetical protein